MTDIEDPLKQDNQAHSVRKKFVPTLKNGAVGIFGILLLTISIFVMLVGLKFAIKFSLGGIFFGALIIGVGFILCNIGAVLSSTLLPSRGLTERGDNLTMIGIGILLYDFWALIYSHVKHTPSLAGQLVVTMLAGIGVFIWGLHLRKQATQTDNDGNLP